MNISHNLDYIHHITGLRAVSAAGYKGTYKAYPKPVEVEDTAAGVMRLSNGGIMQVTALSAFPLNYSDVTVITGKSGVVRQDDDILSLFLNEPYGDYAVGRWNTVAYEDGGNAYSDYFDAWADMQKNGGGVPVSGEDALYVLNLIQKIYCFEELC